MSSADQREPIGMSAYRLVTWPQRYGFAVTAVVAATLLRYALGAMLGFSQPFAFFYPTILLIAILAGFGPGLFATCFAALIATYSFLEPLNSLQVKDTHDLVRLVLFSTMGVAISGLGELTRGRATRLQLFRTLIDQSNDAVEVIDPETLRFLDINQKACHDLGYTREELLAMTVFDINPSVNESTRASVLEKVKASGFAVMEGVHRRKDGSTFPVETSLKCVRLDRNYIVAVSRDITERKRAEEAQRESEDRYRDLVDHSEDLLCTHDLDGNLLSVNPAPARILGYEPAEMLSIPMREMIPPEYVELFDQYVIRIKKNGSDKGLMVVLTRTGERRTWDYNNTLRTEGVSAPIVRGMARDVTERRRAELALINSEQRYRQLFEKTVAGVATLGIDGQLIDCNDAWARMFGWREAKQCHGEQIGNYYPDPAYREVLLDELKRNGAFYNRELQLRRRDGSPFWVLLNSVLLVEGRAQPQIQSTIVDITEHKLAEEALRQSEADLKHAQAAGHIGSWRFDLRTNSVTWSDEGYRIMGLPLGAPVTPEKAKDLIHADDFESATRAWATAKATGRFELECRVPVEGRIRWIRCHASLELDAEGRPASLVGTVKDVTESKESQEALRRREEDYRSFVTQTSEGIFRQDLDEPIPIDLPEDEVVRRILYGSYLAECNDAIAKMYGATVQDLIGKRLTETLDPTDPHNIELTREYVRSGFRVLERESHEVDIHGNPKAFRNSMIGIVENGKLVRTWGIQRDVTEQVRLEQARNKATAALRESEAHFRILVEQASDGIFIASPQGKYVDVNSAGADMLGYTREELLRLSISDIVMADDTPRVAPELAKFEGSDIIRSEWRFRRKDGSSFPGEVSARQLPDGRLQGILRDISERRRAEEAMRQNEERFRVALKGSPITVFNQDRDLRYTWIYNPGLHWEQDILGKTDDEILGPEHSACLNQYKQQVLQTGVGVRGEVQIPYGGRNYAFEVAVEPLRDSAGSIIGITGSFMDIARLRELADGLQEAKEKLVQEKLYLESEIEAQLGFEEIIGQSPALYDVLKQARIVAPTDSTVLLLGETGTGKELVARSIHSLSRRQDKSFIKLNCAAVPSGLLESELFGHEKGAFTGAVSQKVGRIELADNGTLFLDEIGELPLDLQPKLLRVLQDREFERLGGVHTLHVDVRIVSATNRDLKQDVADKNFREDLFYRLNVFPIQLPALRDRRSDVPILIHHFVRKHAMRMNKHIETIPRETMATLQNWNWPGNIRELENMIERMVIMTKDRVLAPPPRELNGPQDLPDDNLTEMERDHIIRVLRETNGVLSGADGAATRLGIKRTTLQSMLKRFGIEPQEYRRGTGTFGPS